MDPIVTWLSPRRLETDKEDLYKSLRMMVSNRMALPKEARRDFYAQVAGKLPPDELWAEAILTVGADRQMLHHILLVLVERN